MNKVAMLYRCGAKDILKAAVENRASACISYMFRGKWRSAKICLNGTGLNVLDIEVAARKKPQLMRIQNNQAVSVLIKYKHMKLIFDTHVLWVIPSQNSTDRQAIVLAVPNQIKLLERRRYSRVLIPEHLHINMRLWRFHNVQSNGHILPEHQWKCRLVDISPKGAQIAFSKAQYPDFVMGDKVGMKFTPMADEMPLILEAKVNNIVATADKNHICLGLEFSGLETSFEGKQVLQRLYTLVEWYELNRCDSSQQNVLPNLSAPDHA